MSSFLNRRVLVAWIALLAVLFGALAPVVSHAMSASRGSPPQWLELCGVNGVKRVQLPASDTPHQPDLMQHMEKCPYCAAHASPQALTPPEAFSFAVVGGHDLYPSLFHHAPAPLFPWAAAKPRGPPATS
ncbi:DUF2946 domain-containing protein [Duganella sp. sic0402]|uniref:DUF2946 domain-containing protein n=1 Tax=Duganella sp. sic0402 TaxID=2854786 RepID=UPI001C485D06|nr:DUF2946 domain-containing protein [Duganella sp. sic0402]MBV7536843.1 DUF2946 domain-containing protein [Duganella sp. sic0402]